MRIALALWGGVLLALSAPLAGTIALAVMAIIAAMTRRTVALPLLLIVVGASLVLIRESGEGVAIKDAPINFVVIARGDSDPLPIRTYGSKRLERSCSFRGESRLLGEERRQIPLRIISSECTIFFGERVTGSGRLRPSDEQRVAATLIIDQIDDRSASLFWSSLAHLRKDFRSLFIERGEAGALVPGMVIGDTSLQDDEFESVMRLAGLSHLTAVSGANFSIVATLVIWLVSIRISNKRIRIAITVAVLLLFTILVRPSPSVLRAGVMAGVVLFAQLRGNQRSSLLALAGAVTLLLLIDPHQGGDAGFALSVLATLGIIAISPRVSEYLIDRWAIPTVVADLIAIPVSATLLCTPIVIAISGKLTLASIPLNIIAAPLVPVVTILGFTALLITPLAHLPADFLAWLSHLAAWPIAKIATLSYQMPIVEMPFGLIGGGMYILVLLGLLLLGRYRRNGRWIAVIVAIALLVSSNLSPRWRLYQCDVGQGDALLLRTSANSAMVIDVGPDPNAIDRCLRQAGIDHISLLVITHLHADHYGGLDGLLRGRSVEKWWLSHLRDEDALNLEELIGSPPTIVESGMRFEIASIEIEVLWPDRDPPSAPRLAGDGSEENNRSIALLLTMDGVRILAGGDIEPVAQSEIARRHDLSRVDIYKVSHHGSHLRSESFDEELDPDLALISVGARNPYGHPAPGALAALYPAKVHRTDIDGAARITWWPLQIR